MNHFWWVLFGGSFLKVKRWIILVSTFMGTFGQYSCLVLLWIFLVGTYGGYFWWELLVGTIGESFLVGPFGGYF